MLIHTIKKNVILSLQPDSYLAGLPTVYSQPPGELRLKRGALVTTIPSLGVEWRVSLQFKATKYDYKGWVNILHLTIGGLKRGREDLTPSPAIYYHPYHPDHPEQPEGWLQVATAIGNNPFSGKPFGCLPYLPYLTLGQWSTVIISQLKTGSYTTVSVNINGTAVWTVENPAPKAFSSVEVYASDPWSLGLAGSIRGLQIKTQ